MVGTEKHAEIFMLTLALSDIAVSFGLLKYSETNPKLFPVSCGRSNFFQ